MDADCELPEFYSERMCNAKKEHRCVECYAPILKGERHYYYSGKWGDGFSSGRQHTDCLNICVFIRDKFQNGECFHFGGLHEVMSEFYWHKCYPKAGRKDLSKEEVDLRRMYAAIRWRERKFRVMRKRVGSIYYKKKWGEQWVVSP